MDSKEYEQITFKTGVQIMSKSASQAEIDFVKKYFPDTEIIFIEDHPELIEENNLQTHSLEDANKPTR